MTAGNITIKGLDDATEYYLYETKAPAGYNRLTDAVKFKITADYDETGKNCTSVTTKVNEDAPQAGLSITVKNNKGAALPFREQPVDQGGADVADVQATRGRRGEADLDGHAETF